MVQIKSKSGGIKDESIDISNDEDTQIPIAIKKCPSETETINESDDSLDIYIPFTKQTYEDSMVQSTVLKC